MAEILDTTDATLPGIYIGKLYRNTPGGLTGYQRRPCIVAKGNRLSLVSNAAITRSRLTNLPITFTAVSPNIASLIHPAVPDQTISELKLANDTNVPTNKWRFSESTPGSGIYDEIVILPEAYSPIASYFITYQSTDRTIQDPLPFQELREITLVGNAENSADYTERANFFVPVDLSVPDPDDGNANSEPTDHAFTAITPVGTPVGTVVPAITSAPLTHNYNRQYTLTVTSVVGPTVTVRASVAQNSGGLESAAQVPLHPSLATPLYPAGMIDTATTGSTNTLTFTDPEIGESIDVSWNLTADTSVLNDTYTFTALGHSFIEIDSAISNTNQWSTVSAVTPAVGNTGTGAVSVRVDTDYSGSSNKSFRLLCSAATGTSPNRTATFLWASWGELPYATGTFTITEATATNLNVLVADGIRLSLAFGGTHFAVGDIFDFSATAARALVTAKDSRNYTFRVGTTVAGAVNALYETDTLEGGFNDVIVTGPVGQMRLPGGVDLWLRNIGSTALQNRYVTGDVWTWSTVDEQVMDWSLTSRATETIPVSSIRTDILGTVTGTVGALYFEVKNLPTSLLYVRDAATGTLVTTATLVPGRPMIQLTSMPSATLEVRYEYIGAEPAPGQTYYVTATILRPASEYDIPKLYTSYGQAAAPALGPSATDNDALIAAQIMLEDCGAPGIYVIQVRDLDGNGTYSDEDYNRAIRKTMSVSQNTDLIVINRSSTLATQLLVNEDANNPFKGHYNLALWVGMPLGSQIGDVDTPGTVVYLAKRTLQKPLQSQSRGTVVLVPNWQATKTITLGDGSEVDVTLDGSFVAAAIAALNASFTDPNTMLLNQVLGGFKTMKNFTDEEKKVLVGASTTYVYNDGTEETPVFKVGEGVTVDFSEDSLREITVALNVRTYTQADMREHLTRTTIGYNPTSEAAGVAYFRTQIALRMAQWNSNKTIADWEEADGAPRGLDPDTDIEVLRSKTRKTLYYFKYKWFGRYGIARGFGLYGVDIQNFMAPV